MTLVPRCEENPEQTSDIALLFVAADLVSISSFSSADNISAQLSRPLSSICFTAKYAC